MGHYIVILLDDTKKQFDADEVIDSPARKTFKREGQLVYEVSNSWIKSVERDGPV